MKDRALLMLKEVIEYCSLKGIEVVFTQNYTNRIIHSSSYEVEFIYKQLADKLDSLHLDKTIKKISL